MAEAGLFIGWGQTVRGREAKGLGVFGDAVNFWTAEQASGAIEGFETVLLGPHGGDLAGFISFVGPTSRSPQSARTRSSNASMRGQEQLSTASASSMPFLVTAVGPAMTIFQDVIAEFS